VAVGPYAVHINSSGSGNTGVGNGALYNVQDSNNVAVGMDALGGFAFGQHNVALGHRAGLNSISGSNNIFLGANISGNFTESNTIYLGVQGTQTRTFVAGIRGNTIANNAVPVLIDSSGQLGTAAAPPDLKEDIRDMGDVSQRLRQLRPVAFRFTQPYRDGSQPIQYGFVADEVAETFPELAVRNPSGALETVRYEMLNAMMLNELKKQHDRIEALEQRLNELSKPRP
jgi:hypothetical protein